MAGFLNMVLQPLGRRLRNHRSGIAHSVISRPGWSAPETINVVSSSFAAGGIIPDVYSGLGRGPNRSPQLAWNNIPDGTVQLLLVLEDLDVPFARPGLHSIALLSPAVTDVTEGELTKKNPQLRWIPTHGGMTTGYTGPSPLPGHGVHHYFFRIFALDVSVPLQAKLKSIADLDAHVSNHVLATGALEGIQEG